MIQQDTFWNDNLLHIDLMENEDVDILFDRASDKGPLIAGKARCFQNIFITSF